MFLAGKKNTVLKSECSSELICPKCNSKSSTNVSVIGTYKHLLQIPFLAGGKTGASICNKCEQKFTQKNMPALIKLAYFELKETSKTPVWFYIGTISIKVLVLIKIFSKYV